MSFLAAGEGFEPSQTESESVVLPLHNPAICCCFVVPCRRDECYYSKQFRIVNSIFQIFLPAPFCPIHRPFVNFFPPPHFLFTQKKCGFIIPPEQEVCGGTSARLFSQKERRLWGHPSQSASAHSQWDDEERGVSKVSADAPPCRPGRAHSLQICGQPQNRGTVAGLRGQMAASLSSRIVSGGN